MKETIKRSKADSEVKELKKEEALKQDIASFFKDRDNQARDQVGQLSESLKAEMEVKQLLYEDSLKVKELPPHIEPMFNSMFLTARRNNIVNENGLFEVTASMGDDLEVDYQDTQLVIAVGPQCQQVKVGMEVRINIENFKVMLSESVAQKIRKDYQYKLPTVTINGIEYLRISERDVDYISNNNK